MNGFQITTGTNKARYLKILFYGDYGVGKTYLAGTAADVPSMGDVLMINAESGDLTLDSEEHNFNSIDSVRVTDFKQVSKAYEFLKAHAHLWAKEDFEGLKNLQEKVTGTKPAKKEDLRHYRTVIVDSLSEVEQFCMNQLLGISDITRLDEETQSAEFKEYKQNHSMMLRMVRNFRDLPMHVIMTAARTFSQDELKRMMFSPQLTGKLSGQVQGFMDVVGYLTTGAAQEDGTIPRRLFVQPTGKFAAKCRFSRFKAPYFDNPTMKGVISKVGLEDVA